MPRLVHEPSTRPGACDPCRANDHAGCIVPATEPEDARLPGPQCTCYDHSWEDHERAAYGIT